MYRKLTSLATVMSTLILWGCTSATTPEQTVGSKAYEIARVVSDKVGTVKQSSADAAGVPIIGLEERHDSRIGQIQHAIELVRLHDKYNLKDIVLEGYLKGSPDMNTDWFTKAIVEKAPEARAQVAMQFLKQGDISAAEFMKLVYSDITLHQAETTERYNVQPPARFMDALEDYFREIGKVDRDWVEEKSKPYQDMESFQKLSGTEKLNLAKEIKQYAESKSVSVSSDSKKAMEQYIDFMDKRMASNNDINDTIKHVVAGSSPKLIAINIGADHTQNMCQLLKDAGHPYAIISPNYSSRGGEHGDLTNDMYERKSKRLPVFSQGLSALILQEISGVKKPEPVISEQWFEAEAELSGYITSLAGGILGPPKPPGPGGKMASGFPDDDFHGKWITILLGKVEHIANQDDKLRALLIPVKFNRSRKVIWVGATLKRGKEQNQASVEAILTQALQDVQAEEKTPEHAEDNTGRIQLSNNTFAIIGDNKEMVKQAILSES